MRVAVLGGGLAGLAAAHALTRSGAAVTLFEAADRFGGQVRTKAVRGFVVEHGAEGCPTRRETLAALWAALGPAEPLIRQAALPTFRLREGALEPLPDGEAARLLGMSVAETDLGAGLTAPCGGMGELVDRLVADLRPSATFLTGTRVRAITARDGGWRIDTGGSRAHQAAAVVCALPPRPAAGLLAPHAPEAAALARLPLASSVTVSLAYPRHAVRHPLNGTGFIAPAAGPGEPVACTFSSSKFAGRAPQGACLLRAFFRPPPGAAWEPEAVWCERAVRHLGPVLGLDEQPLATWTARWQEALPRFPEDHGTAIAALRARLAGLPPIVLAGAGVDGGGVDGALRSGREAAGRLVARSPA